MIIIYTYNGKRIDFKVTYLEAGFSKEQFYEMIMYVDAKSEDGIINDAIRRNRKLYEDTYFIIEKDGKIKMKSSYLGYDNYACIENKNLFMLICQLWMDNLDTEGAIMDHMETHHN